MKTILVVFVLLGITAGSTFESDTERSNIKILGTSSIHDWESEVQDFAIKGTWTEDVISGLQVTIPVNSIKSGKSIMDDKTYDALEESSHPKISFKGNNLKVTGNKITGKGTLFMAGETREIDITADILSDSPTETKLKGAVDLKMSDFDITPPTAMFGTLKTGDEVTVQYDIVLIK